MKYPRWLKRKPVLFNGVPLTKDEFWIEHDKMMKELCIKYCDYPSVPHHCLKIPELKCEDCEVYTSKLLGVKEKKE